MAFRTYHLSLTILFLVVQCVPLLAQSPAELHTFSTQNGIAFDEDLKIAFARDAGDASKARLMDALTGETVRELDFPELLGRPIKVSPDGKILLVDQREKRSARSRFVVLDISQQPKKLFDVKIKDFNPKSLYLPNSNIFFYHGFVFKKSRGMVRQIVQLSGRSTSDGAILFEIDHCPAHYRSQFTSDKKQFWLTNQDRKESEAEVTFYDVATGTIDRTIAIEEIPNYRNSRFQLSNDGTKFAGLVFSKTPDVPSHRTRLAVWDAQTGRLQTDFLAPQDAVSGCRWLDEDIVMSGRNYLFSVSKEKTLGKLQYMPGEFEYTPPSSTRPVKISSLISRSSRKLPGRVLIESHLPSDTMHTICGFPGADTMNAIRALDPEPEIIFKAGEPIHVSFSNPNQSLLPGFDKQVKATLEKVMVDYERVKTSKNRLVATVTEKEGKTKVFGLNSDDRFTIGGKGRSIRLKTATIDFSLYLGDRLIHKLQTGGKTLDKVVVNTGENPAEKLKLSHWTEALKT